jgi:hypothetical protein
MPRISESATLTETAAALETFDAAADPNTVHDVLLADELTDQATFVSASPRADHLPSPRVVGRGAGGEGLTWNLGDVPPAKSLTATLTLSAPTSVGEVVALDAGATAWGTLGGEAVHASACPITLAPDSLGQYLQPTVDADFRGEYVARRAGQLCPDPERAFEYARTLGYEAYEGSLRGARGTEWSQAGNSLDQANLLVATLRGSGTPARYRHGTLSTERARELILSMFPTKGAVVGYVPEGTETSDPAHDPELLEEARDHWWVEAYRDGAWVAMDPSFSYAEPGQTFAAPEGPPLSEVPDEMRHKVTVSVETERYHMLSYLLDGFEYTTPLSYTFTTAELVGEPLTLEHLVAEEHPPMGYAIFGWVYYTYVPYLRLGDGETIIEGHPFWELLSNYPFGQEAVIAEYLHFDVQAPSTGSGQAPDGETTRYTRQIVDRAKSGPKTGPLREPKKIQGLMTADVLQSLGPETPSLVHQLDSHTVYFNPSWMAKEYAAGVGDDLLVKVPRIAEVQSVAASLGDLGSVMEGGYHPQWGAVELAEAAEVVDGSVQAFDRVLGASFVALSDDASRDLGETSLVKAYPDAPRITIASSVISQSKQITRTAQVQMLDLLNDSVRAVAYPGQAEGTERVYRMTRSVCDTFLESAVGEALLGAGTRPDGTRNTQHAIRSAANVLQAAQAQSIPLTYVDQSRLDVLARLEISTQAKAFVMDAVQKGYGVLVPERMVDWNGGQAVAWWQLDLETGEMVGVGEDGTHASLITTPLKVIAALAAFDVVLWITAWLVSRWRAWTDATMAMWDYFWRRSMDEVPDKGQPQEIYREALEETKRYMRSEAWEQFKEQWWGLPPASWLK